MPRPRTLLLALLTVLLAVLAVPGTAGAAEPVELSLFWREGCPYCAAEHAWLEQELQPRYPTLQVHAYELSRSAANRDRFLRAAERLGFDPTGVPTTIVGDRYWVGFDQRTAASIEATVAALAVPIGPDPAPDGGSEAPDTVVEVPLLGEVDVGTQSLVVSTLLIGLLDGFNPCSLWVLSVLLGLVLHTGSRRRVVWVGATFLVITTALYGVYIGGLLSILSYVAYVTWIRVGVAALAAGFGAVNVKDYIAFKRGPSLSIPERAKPGLYRRMRAVSRPDQALPAVLLGTAAMAAGVSLLETPCTAGFPVLWSNLLADQGVGWAGSAALFSLYMFVFLLDELLVFGVAVATMRAAKLQERHGRVLKLVGGVVMLTLAGVMLAAPDLLESVTGTLVVFGGAGLVTLVVVLVHGALVGHHGAPRGRPSRHRTPPHTPRGRAPRHTARPVRR